MRSKLPVSNPREELGAKGSVVFCLGSGQVGTLALAPVEDTSSQPAAGAFLLSSQRHPHHTCPGPSCILWPRMALDSCQGGQIGTRGFSGLSEDVSPDSSD